MSTIMSEKPEVPEVRRRTFVAKKYPKGSCTREIFNMYAETSEYYPSRKYCTVFTDGHRTTFRTKREAEEAAKG